MSRENVKNINKIVMNNVKRRRESKTEIEWRERKELKIFFRKKRKKRVGKRIEVNKREVENEIKRTEREQ